MKGASTLSLQKVNEMKVKVEGLHCAHCEKAVETELLKLSFVEKAKADAAKGEVKLTVKGEADNAMITAAVEAAGFKVVEIIEKKRWFR